MGDDRNEARPEQRNKIVIRFWIGVASLEHVKLGKNGGFCQLCHGKAAPLKRMKKGDFIIYYSSKENIHDKTPCQKFSAIGKIKDDHIYQFSMSEDFVPFKRDVDFFDSIDYPIEPLIHDLSFIANKRSWGFPFRYGFLEINKDDFSLIATHMLDKNTHGQIRENLFK